MKKLIFSALTLALLSGCSGLRTTDETFTSHAENFNLLFMQFPGGDTQERAMALVPPGAEIKTLISTPNDTDSLIGVMSRLLGVDYTTVNGELKK